MVLPAGLLRRPVLFPAIHGAHTLVRRGATLSTAPGFYYRESFNAVDNTCHRGVRAGGGWYCHAAAQTDAQPLAEVDHSGVWRFGHVELPDLLRVFLVRAPAAASASRVGAGSQRKRRGVLATLDVLLADDHGVYRARQQKCAAPGHRGWRDQRL